MPLFPRLEAEAAEPDARPDPPAAIGRTIGRCASSIPTATSTPTASTATSSSSSAARGWRASSGSSSRAGTCAPRSARSSSSPAGRGWTPPSASIPTTRPRSTRDGWATDRGAGRATSGSSRSARRASTRTGCSRPGTRSSRTCGGNLAPRPRDRQARDPPLPVAARGARRAGRARRASCARPGSAARRRAQAFGDRPPAVIHRSRGPVDYAETVLAIGPRGLVLGPRVPARRGGLGRRRAARPGRAPARRDRLAVPLAAGRAARPQRAALRRDHRALGSRSAAGWGRTSSATALVAAYDATFRAR